MAKPNMKTFDMPNHPGQYVVIPRKVGGRRKTAINAAVNPAEPVGRDENGNILWRPGFDLNTGAFEALLQGACHEDAHWTLKDEHGKPLPRDRATIENDTEYEDDFLQIAGSVYRWVMGLDDETPPTEKKDEPSAPTPADDSSSKTSTGRGRGGRRTLSE